MCECIQECRYFLSFCHPYVSENGSFKAGSVFTGVLEDPKHSQGNIVAP